MVSKNQRLCPWGSITYVQFDLIDVTNDLSSRWVEDDGSGRKSSDSEFLLMDVLFSHDEGLIWVEELLPKAIGGCCC